MLLNAMDDRNQEDQILYFISNATTVETAQVVQHKDGPQLGSYWIKNGLDFSWLKLTNKRHFVTDRHAFVEPRQHYRAIVRIEDVSNLDIHFIYSNQDQVFITVTVFVSEQFLELKDMWIKSRKKAGGPKKRSSGGEGGTFGNKQKKEKSFDDDCDADLDEMLWNAMNDRKQKNQLVESIPSTSVAQELSTPLTHFNEENEDLFTEFSVVPPSAQNVPSPGVTYQLETIVSEQIDQYVNQSAEVQLEDPNNWSNESLKAIYMAYQAQEQISSLLGYQIIPVKYEVIQPIPVEKSYDQGYNSNKSFPEDFHVYPPEQYQNNYWSNMENDNAAFFSPN
uniref:T-box domain-containing protein n=1 Tax=Caenorhabditis japonica TaxID=281687 RepID=A0A8R1EFV9_CAEJA